MDRNNIESGQIHLRSENLVEQVVVLGEISEAVENS